MHNEALERFEERSRRAKYDGLLNLVLNEAEALASAEGYDPHALFTAVRQLRDEFGPRKD